MNILIISAVKAESSHIIEELCLKEISGGLFDSYFTVTLEKDQIHLIHTGIGAVNTALFLGSAIQSIQPDLIIQTGIAGSFREKGPELCGIALADSETDIQLGLESENLVDDLPFNIFTDGNESIKNRINLNKDLVDKAEYILDKAFKVTRGDFVSASTITTTDERASLIEKNFQPVVESMEGFSAALVSRVLGINFLEIRSASNFVGKRDRESWKVANACLECSKAVLHYLNHYNR